jgi:hypothetical protein
LKIRPALQEICGSEKIGVFESGLQGIAEELVDLGKPDAIGLTWSYAAKDPTP